MRVIDNEHFRHQIMAAIDIAERVSKCKPRFNRFNYASYLEGYIDGLTRALAMLEDEEHVSTIIGDNNLHKLSIKEREHRVRQKH